MSKEYAYFGQHDKSELELMGEYAKQIVLSNYVRQCMGDPAWDGQPIHFAWSEFKDGFIQAGASFDLELKK
jgi:hypothetical protein